MEGRGEGRWDAVELNHPSNCTWEIVIRRLMSHCVTNRRRGAQGGSGGVIMWKGGWAEWRRWADVM